MYPSPEEMAMLLEVSDILLVYLMLLLVVATVVSGLIVMGYCIRNRER